MTQQLLKLPDDILLIIFNLLDVKTLARCKSVCRRLHKIFKNYKINHRFDVLLITEDRFIIIPLWKTVEKEKFPGIQLHLKKYNASIEIAAAVESLGNDEPVVVETINGKAMTSLLSNIPACLSKSTVSTILTCSINIDANWFELFHKALNGCCLHCTSLVFYDCTMRVRYEELAKLVGMFRPTDLSFQHIRGAANEAICDQLFEQHHLRQIRSLTLLNTSSSVTDKIFATQLSSFYITGHHQLSPEGVLKTIEDWKCGRKLLTCLLVEDVKFQKSLTTSIQNTQGLQRFISSGHDFLYFSCVALL